MGSNVFLCPSCGQPMFEVYFGDKKLRWRCLCDGKVYEQKGMFDEESKKLTTIN